MGWVDGAGKWDMLKDKNLGFSVCCKFCWRYNLHNFLTRVGNCFTERTFEANFFTELTFERIFFTARTFEKTFFLLNALLNWKMLLNVLLKRIFFIESTLEWIFFTERTFEAKLFTSFKTYLIKYSKHSQHNSIKARISSKQVN